MQTKNLIGISVVVIILFFTAALMAQENSMTPKESEAVKYIKQGQIVFLCFYSETDLSTSAARSNIDTVVGGFKGGIKAVYVNDSDRLEDGLRGKFKVLPGETSVFVIRSNGSVAGKIGGGNITKENLTSALFSSCGGGTCGSSCR